MIPKSGNRFSEKIMLQQKDRSMTQTKVLSDLNAMVWKIEVAAGQRVAAGDTLLVLEAMKMEIPVTAPRAGTVAAILVAEKQMVAEGETLALLDG